MYIRSHGGHRREKESVWLHQLEMIPPAMGHLTFPLGNGCEAHQILHTLQQLLDAV